MNFLQRLAANTPGYGWSDPDFGEALKECSADFVNNSSDHKVAAQEILNEFERRALLARAALKEKE